MDMDNVVEFKNKNKIVFIDKINADSYLVYTCINILSELQYPLNTEGVIAYQNNVGLPATGIIGLDELFSMIDNLDMNNRQSVLDHLDRVEFTKYINKNKNIINKNNKESKNKKSVASFIGSLIIIFIFVYGSIYLVKDLFEFISGLIIK